MGISARRSASACAVAAGIADGQISHSRRAKARSLGAVTIGITSNRKSPIARIVQILIAPDTGPEAIAGSTRLKAGTAQKMVLNMLSTATMVRLGRVYDNWMIGVALTNRKLQARRLRILREASGKGVAESTRALRQSGHNLGVALIMLKTGASARQAKRLLRDTHGHVHNALNRAKNIANSSHNEHG